MGISVQSLDAFDGELGLSFPNPLKALKGAIEGVGEALVGIVTDPVDFAENIAEAAEALLCNLTANEWVLRLEQAGLIAEGVPPATAKLIAEVAKAMCTLLPILESDADVEFKTAAVLLILADIFIP